MKEKIAKLLALTKKLQSGEKLSDDENSFLTSFDSETVVNGLQAEARKKAERETTDAKDKIRLLEEQIEALKENGDSKKTDVERLQDQIRDMQKQLKDQTKMYEEERSKAAALSRTQKIQELAKAAGIEFVDGVDASLLFHGLESRLSAVDDLNDGTVVTPIFDTFKTANKGVIKSLAPGGAGSGGGVVQSKGNALNPFSSKSLNITEQMRIRHSDPAKAAALEAAAAAETVETK